MSTKITYAIAAIAATLAWDATHEPGADGLFLQPEEATLLNTALENAAKSTEELNTANQTIEQQNSKITELSNAATKDADTIKQLNQTVADLQEQVKKMGGQESGTGTKLVTKKEPVDEESPKSSILDPESDLNRYAKARIAAAAKMKGKK